MNKVLIISDIDGVVADNSHRLPLMYKKDWDNFYSDTMIERDELIKAGRELLDNISGDEKPVIIYVTGRRESCRDATRRWLGQHCCANYDAMFMRPEGDFRKAPKLKVDWIKKFLEVCHAADEEFEFIFFIDDDPKNVKAVVEEVKEYKGTPITGITFGIDRFPQGISEIIGEEDLDNVV